MGYYIQPLCCTTKYKEWMIGRSNWPCGIQYYVRNVYILGCTACLRVTYRSSLPLIHLHLLLGHWSLHISLASFFPLTYGSRCSHSFHWVLRQGRGSTWELGEKTVSRSCFGPHVSHGFFQALVFNIFWHRQTETAGFHQFGIKTSSVRAFPCDLFAPTCTCECILELEHWLEWDTLLGYHVGQNVWGRVDDLA